MKIKAVSYDYAKRTVTVYYKSGAIRTYRGRVPFSVCEYLMYKERINGYTDGWNECESANENGEVF